MTTAVDIITYIGIPLAVLGILPTFYTVLTSYITLRTIRRILSQNHVPAITRSSLLSGIVEIEIQRKSIQPLDREDEAYFASNLTQGDRSLLRGGSWTVFHWKEMVIGMKSYRLQYHDELMQPQAEIDFERLVAFLLDRGAVPSVAGFSDLRSSGLWTPAGTKLLLSPTTNDGVLMVAPSDDSDGILSLCLEWKKEWDLRDYDSLPPYWIRVKPQVMLPAQVDKADKTEDKGETDPSDPVPAYTPSPEVHDSPIRLRIGASGVEEAYREGHISLRHSSSPLPLAHILSVPHTNVIPPTVLWFAVAATAFGAPAGGLWSFAIPPSIASLSSHETVPCGILVLLDFLSDDEVPVWRSAADQADQGMELHIKTMERHRRMAAESRLPPAEQARARQKRIEEERWEFHNETLRRQGEARKREERAFQEAILSQKLAIGNITIGTMRWLVKQGHVQEGASAADVMEHVLVRMVEDEAFAKKLAGMLEKWKGWAENSGMRKEHFDAVMEDKESFAFASVVLELVRASAAPAQGNVVSDLQECLRMWKKVRLG